MPNKRISRYLDDIDNTEKKIDELQQHLKDVRARLKEDEDIEMVKSLRSVKMSGRELLALMEGIQNGTVEFKMARPAGEHEGGSGTDAADNDEKAPVALESEDTDDDIKKDIQ